MSEAIEEFRVAIHEMIKGETYYGNAEALPLNEASAATLKKLAAKAAETPGGTEEAASWVSYVDHLAYDAAVVSYNAERITYRQYDVDRAFLVDALAMPKGKDIAAMQKTVNDDLEVLCRATDGYNLLSANYDAWSALTIEVDKLPRR